MADIGLDFEKGGQAEKVDAGNVEPQPRLEAEMFVVEGASED